MSTLLEIAKIQEARKNKELEVYKNIFTRVQYKIYIYASKGSSACIYKIPNFIFGYPLINVPKTMEYVIGRLTHQGFIAFKYDEEHIYINWDLSKQKRKELKEQEERESKIQLSEKDELTNTLVRLKRLSSS
jgi:hypothetical protein